LTEVEGFQGESWTVQVEIVEQEMLGALPADEDPIPVPQVQDNSLPFDFFGLGQQGLAHEQQNNQNWVHNAFGEQIGHQHNLMDLDLNIEAVVEGDDQDFEAFQNLLDMGQDHAHNQVP
jgi:hypothetical protein